MRSLIYALMVVIVLNLLAAGAFVGYLAASDRLSTERMQKVVDLFKPTIHERKQQIVQAKSQAKEQAKQQAQALRLERAADGPKTLQQRLDQKQRHEQLNAQRIERLKRAKQDILRQVAQAKKVVSKQRKQIKASRQKFDKRVKAFENQQKQKDFKKAVGLLEQLQPAKAKKLVQDMLSQGKEQTVIAYLAAMQQRKAGKILGQFNSPQEISQARRLLEGLRQRGTKLANPPFRVNQNQAQPGQPPPNNPNRS